MECGIIGNVHGYAVMKNGNGVRVNIPPNELLSVGDKVMLYVNERGNIEIEKIEEK